MTEERLDLVEVADSGTEFGAEIMAGAVREAGVRAAVAPPDALSTAGLGTWRVFVPLADAIVAREAIIASRQDAGELRLENCLSCGYALEGLDSQAKCPECGQELSRGRIEAIMRGTRIRGTVAPSVKKEVIAWVVLGFAACIVAGLLEWQGFSGGSPVAGGWGPVVVVAPVIALAAAGWKILRKRRGAAEQR